MEVEETKRRRKTRDVRLVLALGRQEPGGDGHGDDDDQADEDAVSAEGGSRKAGRSRHERALSASVFLSFPSCPDFPFAQPQPAAAKVRTYPAAMVCAYVCGRVCVLSV